MNAITPKIRKVLEDYALGTFSAEEAARRMGADATVHDVIFQMREAGLALPRPPRDVEQAELARALKMLGLTQ